MDSFQHHAQCYGNPADDVFQIHSTGSSPSDRRRTFPQNTGELDKKQACDSSIMSKESIPVVPCWPRTANKFQTSGGDKPNSPIKRAFAAVVRTLQNPYKRCSSPACEQQGTPELPPRAERDFPSSPPKMRFPSPKNLHSTSKGASILATPSPTKSFGRGQLFRRGQGQTTPTKLRFKQSIRMAEPSDYGSSISEDTSILEDHQQTTQIPSQWPESPEKILHPKPRGTIDIEINNSTQSRNEESREASPVAAGQLSSVYRLFPMPPRHSHPSKSSKKLSLGQLSAFEVDFSSLAKGRSLAPAEVPAPLFHCRTRCSSHHRRQVSSINDTEVEPCDLNHNLVPVQGMIPPTVLTSHRRRPSPSCQRSVRRYQSPHCHPRSTRLSRYQLSIGEISVFECDLPSNQVDNISLSRPVSRSSNHFPRTYGVYAGTTSAAFGRPHHSPRKLRQFRFPYMSPNGSISTKCDNASVYGSSLCCSSTLEEEEVVSLPMTYVASHENKIGECADQWPNPTAAANFLSQLLLEHQGQVQRSKNNQIGAVMMNALETLHDPPEGSGTGEVEPNLWSSGACFAGLAEYTKPPRINIVTIAKL
ncbi:hypothetical protein BGZ60DRAFT_438480 [Tricladium varicosporioides]|nr:hypothetical protein BGZ60DRAFT_438480 [Hymenoscyphus varicosporioides]